MSVYYDKSKNAWRFTFSRIINDRSVRATKLLPKGWSKAEADAFDVKESSRLYSMHSVGEKSKPLISDAVLAYLTEHTHQLKTASEFVEEYSRLYPLYEGKLIDELPDVAKAINKLNVSAATRRKKIRMLSAACNYGFKYHNMGDYKPSDKVIVPKVNNSRDKPPSRAQVISIARACKARDVRACILVALYSGMRQGEILKAEVEDDMFKLYDTKNGSVRFVPMHSRLKVYTSRFPSPCGHARLHNRFTEAKIKLGFEEYRFHDIRHTSASAMINEGVDLYTVGAVLGHKSPISTRRYSHLLTDTLTKAINKIGGKANQERR